MRVRVEIGVVTIGIFIPIFHFLLRVMVVHPVPITMCVISVIMARGDTRYMAMLILFMCSAAAEGVMV